jgi:hypothetical protein
VSNNAETVIRNMVYILILELVLLPIGVFLYLIRGFHIYHVVLGFGYLYGIGLIVETANILIKHVKFVDTKENKEVPK